MLAEIYTEWCRRHVDYNRANRQINRRLIIEFFKKKYELGPEDVLRMGIAEAYRQYRHEKGLE